MTKKSQRMQRKKIARAAAVGGLTLVWGHQAAAQNAQGQAPSNNLESAIAEVVVTATKRAASIESVPYNISAISGDVLTSTGVQNLRELAQQVPGFTLLDRGGAFVGSSVPIIRGLNASSTVRPGLAFEQMPVGIYLGNSPVVGFFPIDDITRVEVLRGPQGTLYGAGALGGAVRLIPNSPVLDTWSANVTASAENVSHSADVGYEYSGLVNVPLGHQSALRLSAKYDNEPGYIDQFGIERRQGDLITSAPVLANPADVANSPGVYYNQKDANFTHITSGRASLLLQPTDLLKIEIGFNISRLNGMNGPVDKPNFAGGPYPVDPRITLPAGGAYRTLGPTLQPYHRDSDLTSIDASYDMGFATLSSTTSYYETAGYTGVDTNNPVFILDPAFYPYYMGSPADPRFASTSVYTDSNHTVTDELRLVSNGHNRFDYVAGAYYEHGSRNLSWDLYLPGVKEQGIAANGIDGFWLATDPSTGRSFHQVSPSTFVEKTLFGEVTWNITNKLQLTGGGRFFKQDFTQNQEFEIYTFGQSGQNTTAHVVSDHIFKLNGAYEYSDNHRIYATYSQGFRRGGANAFTTDGVFHEPISILGYAPDKANNFEVGLKGRLANGMRYTVDVFDVDWQHPQIGTFTRNGWAIVVNGAAASSKGFEFELQTPLFISGLELSLGYAYVDAKLTKEFCLPDGDGTADPNGFIPCDITGKSGAVLPGTPKNSGAATLTYTHAISGKRTISYLLNASYKGSVLNAMPVAGFAPTFTPSYTLTNASVAWKAESHWSIALLVNNLFNKRAVFGNPLRPVPVLESYGAEYTVSQPRTVALRLGYDW